MLEPSSHSRERESERDRGRSDGSKLLNTLKIKRERERGIVGLELGFENLGFQSTKGNEGPVHFVGFFLSGAFN